MKRTEMTLGSTYEATVESPNSAYTGKPLYVKVIGPGNYKVNVDFGVEERKGVNIEVVSIGSRVAQYRMESIEDINDSFSDSFSGMAGGYREIKAGDQFVIPSRLIVREVDADEPMRVEADAINERLTHARKKQQRYNESFELVKRMDRNGILWLILDDDEDDTHLREGGNEGGPFSLEKVTDEDPFYSWRSSDDRDKWSRLCDIIERAALTDGGAPVEGPEAYEDIVHA